MNKNYKNPYLLIDGNYCLYQSHYTFINLKNKNKFPTSILYGFIKILNKLIQKIQPKKIIVIFDAPTKNFRHKLYKDYKKNRKIMPKEIKIQIKPLKKIILSMGISILKIKNCEADDIIGTLSVQLKKKNNCIFIYSADKDMIQLIKKDIFIIPGYTKKKF